MAGRNPESDLDELAAHATREYRRDSCLYYYDGEPCFFMGNVQSETKESEDGESAFFRVWIPAAEAIGVKDIDGTFAPQMRFRD